MLRPLDVRPDVAIPQRRGHLQGAIGPPDNFEIAGPVGFPPVVDNEVVTEAPDGTVPEPGAERRRRVVPGDHGRLGTALFQGADQDVQRDSNVSGEIGLHPVEVSDDVVDRPSPKGSCRNRTSCAVVFAAWWP